MATRGRKKAITEPTPSTRDPRDVETIERLQQRIEESEVLNNQLFTNFPEFKLLHPYQGESLVIQQVLSVAPSKSIDDNSCR
ncbi:hypothetical protein Tco_0423864, partial [Tanacetum coccineum]